MNMIIDYAVEMHSNKSNRCFKNDKNNKISDILFIVVILVLVFSIICGVFLYLHKHYRVKTKYINSHYNSIYDLPSYEIDFSTYKRFKKIFSYTTNISKISEFNNYFDVYKVSSDNNIVLHQGSVYSSNSEVTFNLDHNYKKYIIVYVPLQDIVLTSSSIKIGKNYQKVLEYKLVPNNCTNSQLTYINNSEDIAQIDAFGIITGLKAGATTIKVGVEGERIFTKIYVDVLEIVENIVLNTSSISLKINENFKINATITPENSANTKLFWRSSDESVAKVVSSGYITATRYWKLYYFCKYHVI